MRTESDGFVILIFSSSKINNKTVKFNIPHQSLESVLTNKKKALWVCGFEFYSPKREREGEWKVKL